MKRAGKRTLAWENVRAKLKVKMLTLGITTCELQFTGCWRDNALGFAHAKKRRNLKPHELSEAILVCNPCHDQIELLPEQEMTRVVRDTIRKRFLKKSVAINKQWAHSALTPFD